MRIVRLLLSAAKQRRPSHISSTFSFIFPLWGKRHFSSKTTSYCFLLPQLLPYAVQKTPCVGTRMCSASAVSVLWKVFSERYLSVLSVFSEYSPSVLRMFSECSMSVLRMFSQCSLTSDCSLNVFWVSLNALCVSVNVLWWASSFSMKERKSAVLWELMKLTARSLRTIPPWWSHKLPRPALNTDSQPGDEHWTVILRD